MASRIGMSEASYDPRSNRLRIANACDGCKSRKVRCDGKVPCSYCVRRQQPSLCSYTQPARRRRARPAEPHTAPRTVGHSRDGPDDIDAGGSPLSCHITGEKDQSTQQPAAEARACVDELPPGGGPESGPPSVDATTLAEETDVPREARLLCDAQGKLVFIGDCAPLSFFQSIRQLVISTVDHEAFAPHTSGYSVLENASLRHPFSMHSARNAPRVDAALIATTVSVYLGTTTGVIDLFSDNAALVHDICLWASHISEEDSSVSSANYYLVLAIGTYQSNESLANTYFLYGKSLALESLGGNLSTSTIQAFMLVSFYMLVSCQINGSFLFFGIAARAAYSVGLHRTEVNGRFGPVIHRHRDRLWKSLRVLDLFLSTSMGRPPATSGVDCTVSYQSLDDGGQEVFDILDASAQIFLIIESIVVEIYSRRKISLQLTEGISRQLREWSARWLQQVKSTAALTPRPDSIPHINGAVQVMASYYYGVMLVSRPFLMYELQSRLSTDNQPFKASGKMRLADACIDAATFMTDAALDLIEKGVASRQLPLLVYEPLFNPVRRPESLRQFADSSPPRSWLFASSLVLGVGLLAGFGRILDKYTRRSVTALEYFAKCDAHAVQYSLIAKSLLTTALSHLEQRERDERARRAESSAQLFGLVPKPSGNGGDATTSDSPSPGHRHPLPSAAESRSHENNHRSFSWDQEALDANTGSSAADIDVLSGPVSDFLAENQDLSLMGATFDSANDFEIGALNLFPLLGGGGHIDLNHYF